MATKSDAKALSVSKSIVRSMSGPFSRSLAKEVLRGAEDDLAKSIPKYIGGVINALTRTVYETTEFNNDNPLMSYNDILATMSLEEFAHLLSASLTDKNEIGEDVVEKMIDDFADTVSSSMEGAILKAMSPKSLSKVMSEALEDSYSPIADALCEYRSQGERPHPREELSKSGWERLSKRLESGLERG